MNSVTRIRISISIATITMVITRNIIVITCQFAITGNMQKFSNKAYLCALRPCLQYRLKTSNTSCDLLNINQILPFIS